MFKLVGMSRWLAASVGGWVDGVLLCLVNVVTQHVGVVNFLKATAESRNKELK